MRITSIIRGKKKSGYSFLELVTVVFIVLILSSFIFGYFTGILQESRESVTRTNLIKVREALSRYFKDNLAYPSSLASLQPNYLLEHPRDILILPLQVSSASVIIQVPGTTTPGIYVSPNAYLATITYWADYDFSNPGLNASQIRDVRIVIENKVQLW